MNADGGMGESENSPLVVQNTQSSARSSERRSGATTLVLVNSAEVEEGTGSLVAAMVITIVLLPLPWLLSTAYEVPVAAAHTCAVALLMAAYWSLEPLPLAVTALLPVVLLPVLGVLPASHVAVHYMNTSNMLFLGTLFVAAAVEQSGLHYRLALGVLRVVGTQRHKLLLGFMGACGFLSMFISNSATAACMLPIARKLLHTVGQRQRASSECDREAQRFRKGLLLGVAYSCSLGGMASLTGTGTNIAFAGFWSATYGTAGREVMTFGRWILFALPLSATLLLVVWLVLCARFIGLQVIFSQQGDPVSSIDAAVIDAEARALGPMTAREKTVLAHFIGQTVLWLTRDMGGGLGWGGLFEDGYVSDATVAMATACSLFMMPAGSSSTSNACRTINTPRAIYEHTVAQEGAEVLPILRQPKQPDSEPAGVDRKGTGLGSAAAPGAVSKRQSDGGDGGANGGGSGTESRASIAGVRIGGDGGKTVSTEAVVERCLDGNAVKSVDWGVVLLLGGGFALADAFDESGLSEYLGAYVMAPLAELSLALVTVGVCAVMSLLTEFTSNVASISVALPLLAAAAERMEVSPVLLLVPATCAASCAFMLPVATPPNAVVFAGGGLAVKDMLVSGLIANILAVVIICVYTPVVAPYVFEI